MRRKKPRRFARLAQIPHGAKTLVRNDNGEGRPRGRPLFFSENCNRALMPAWLLKKELRIRRLLDECKQACQQSVFTPLRQLDEAEGLQPALGRPHGKHDLRFLADGSFTEVEN